MLTALAATLALTQADVSWSASLRNELRARAFSVSDVQAAVPFAMDFELQPDGRIDFVGRRLRFATSYTPRIILRNIDSGRTTPAMLQRWAAELTIRASRTLQLSIDETASYGVTDFSSLLGLTSSFDATQLAPRLEAIPLGGLRVTTVSSRTQLTLNGRATRRVNTSAGVYYYVSGGLSPQDQASLPLQYGPGMFVDASYIVVRRHLLGARFHFDQTDFSTGQSFTTAELVGRWVWTMQNAGALTLQGGVAAVRAYLPTDAFYSVTIAPNVRATYTVTLDSTAGSFVLQLSAGMAPFLDRVLAAFYERVELSASGRWQVNDNLTLRLQAQWTMAVFDRNYQGQQLSLTEAGALIRMSRRLSFDAGARVLFAQQAAVAQATVGLAQNQLQWLVFVGLTGSVGGDF